MRAVVWLGALTLSMSSYLFLAPVQAARRGPQFSGVGKCRACHEKEDIGNQQGIWLDSPHARAFDTLASDQAKKIVQERGLGANPQAVAECLECHTSAHGEPKKRVARSYKAEEGVTCEACHGPGSIYRKKKIMLDHEKSVQFGLIEPEEKVCLDCHNDRSPSWDPARYTLADGTQTGFDFFQAAKKIAHPVPEGYDPNTSSDEEEEDDDE